MSLWTFSFPSSFEEEPILSLVRASCKPCWTSRALILILHKLKSFSPVNFSTSNFVVPIEPKLLIPLVVFQTQIYNNIQRSPIQKSEYDPIQYNSIYIYMYTDSKQNLTQESQYDKILINTETQLRYTHDMIMITG
ncbi:hypothetical protein I3842_09G085700 [Carya illinoinensis]|uniref:Uncharacterized protein n=1 Tax=Carya illinoinensis TaxID=32201 RepID=A0A922E1X9_CARIL|nr:hypothetical protein I3842_09G085700 [Carya illinoinensis]